jgi:hypothetical protein
VSSSFLRFIKVCDNSISSSVCLVEYLFRNIIHSQSRSRLNNFTCDSTISRFPVTGPVARFARQIASQGYIVAAPSSYHEFTGPEPLAYDGPGTDAGNEWKITKKVAAYDEDAKLSVDILLDLETCNGRIGATGSSPFTSPKARTTVEHPITSLVPPMLQPTN